MSCCAPGAEATACEVRPQSLEEVVSASRDLGDGRLQSVLNVPGVHCGACIRTVEQAVGALPGVESARLNLSTRRLVVSWRRGALDPAALFASLAASGYPAFLADPAADGGDRELRGLLVSLAVAGFAAGNIMLLSVSVWSGAEGATRDLFHWISALIAFPAIAFAGRPFFRSAWSALRGLRLNMDVPISLAVLLAAAMSLYETVNHGESAYFDAAVSLLFFLLIGRVLDHVMREKARSAVRMLDRLAPRGAVVIGRDGRRQYRPLGDIVPGMRLHVAAGERLAVDCVVRAGVGELDFSIVNGEDVPTEAAPGLAVPAGVMNLSGPLEVEATARAADSFVAEMVRMMEAAESSRAGFRRLADRAADIYAPAVHLLALATFVFWIVAGAGWHAAAFTAIAVLVITCPCALGLAVPIVQVVAAGRLFRDGIMVRSGAALERLAEADHAVFDKTGTLTVGQPRLVGARRFDSVELALAGTLAGASRHPYSRAIAAEAEGLPPAAVTDIREIAGHGVEARLSGRTVRLGKAEWALAGVPGRQPGDCDDGAVVLSIDGRERARFSFTDPVRPGAAETVRRLAAMGLDSEVLSGDAPGRVAALAGRLGIAGHRARATPADKLARLGELAAAGRKVLMVGDGINDAPALAAAHVSFAPASAADIGRNAADFVFLHDDLRAIVDALDVSRRARRLMLGNFALAIGYNVVAVPLAVAGYASPLVAALAMSSSSVLVTLNALRLNYGHLRRDGRPGDMPGSLSVATARLGEGVS